MEAERTPGPSHPDPDYTHLNLEHPPSAEHLQPTEHTSTLTPAEDEVVMTDVDAAEPPAKETDTLPPPIPDTSSSSAPPPASPSSSPAPPQAPTPTPADEPTPAPIPEPTIIQLISTSAIDPSRTRTFHAKYFKPVTHDAPLRAALDLPEAYFAPTPSELQQAFAGQVKKREQLVDAPMLTQKLRDQEERRKERDKIGRWPQTRIRIRFADRSQLEGVFPSTDKMVAIYEFVKLAIAEEHRQKPFVLYQTPPRREFVKGDPALKGKTLIDLQLTPSSVFYIKWEDDTLSSATPPPLSPAVLGGASEFPLPPAFDPRKEQAQAQASGAGEPKAKTQKLGFGGASGKVTPSWLKLGKSGKK